MNVLCKIAQKATQAVTWADIQRIEIPSEAEAKACAKAKDDNSWVNLSYRGALGYE